MKHLPPSLNHFVEDHYTPGMMLADLLTSLEVPRSLGFYPRIIRLPEGHRVYVSDTQTVFCTLPELYEVNDYELYPDFKARRGWTVLDVGANVGLYSLRAARRVGDEGLVVSFEPNPVSFYWLEKNISLNRMRNVMPSSIALGYKEGYADFYAGTGNNIRLSSFNSTHMIAAQRRVDPNVHTIRVPVRQLDSFMRTEFEGRSVDLMKVDVEGSELDVLRGAAKLLDNFMIHRLVVEVHLEVVRDAELTDVLALHQYRVVRTVKQNEMKEILYALPVSREARWEDSTASGTN